MKKLMSVVAVALFLGACSGQSAQTTAEPVNVKSIHGDLAISESRPAEPLATFPKRGKAMEREFVHQPPLMPHKEYSITAKKNSCLSCHGPGKKMAPTVHETHLKSPTELNMHWYNCNQCHVHQADNKTELVGGNTYSSN
ncbi:nitrate reductase cytochrome c-type subunit [Paraferrimonas haliotis]|uniref:Periplasmic nitrate reductase, electron transfer subunit n=1 Tax=Paraferrimonas haliotis TaxID=2013866 RepID=A0AA37TQZ9_9GAMM|nr:nitrate reductase cytochrome c-type subunit [Paraferrimonas haliotis]GLS83056.1 periplasmic nitrate reductase, electron transfer subunit [Paraferrimonas haliotis]